MTEQTEAVAVFRQLLETRNGADHAAGTNGVNGAHPLRAAEPANVGHLPTGVSRLDELLGGGLPAGSATLLHGAPFTGKGLLQRSFFLQGLRTASPAAYILTDTSVPDLFGKLSHLDAKAPLLADAGTAHYIDAYSRLIGDEESYPGVHYIEELRNLNRIARTLDTIDRDLRANNRSLQRVVIQSLSTLMMEAGSPEAFRLLRTVIGRIVRRGGTVLAGLEAGMHTEADVQATKHLCNGMIQTREAEERFYLRIEGLPTRYHPGWVEYEFGPGRFELTGSFSSERIRGTALTT